MSPLRKPSHSIASSPNKTWTRLSQSWPGAWGLSVGFCSARTNRRERERLSGRVSVPFSPWRASFREHSPVLSKLCRPTTLRPAGNPGPSRMTVSFVRPCRCCRRQIGNANKCCKQRWPRRRVPVSRAETSTFDGRVCSKGSAERASQTGHVGAVAAFAPGGWEGGSTPTRWDRLQPVLRYRWCRGSQQAGQSLCYRVR